VMALLVLQAAACAFALTTPRAARLTPRGVAVCCLSPAPAEMRVKALKEELDERGVAWRGVAFEKDELVKLLTEARAQPVQESAPAADNSEPEASPAAPDDDSAAQYEAAYAEALANALKLKTKELRTRLAARKRGWADLYEKEELAARLAGLEATASLFSRSGALSPGSVAIVDGEQLRAEMVDERTPLLLDVFATWCGPCKLIAPQLEALAAKAGDRCRFAKLDSDAEPQISSELNVQGLPTLIFVRDGAEVHRLEGVPGNAAALEALVGQYLGVDF